MYSAKEAAKMTGLSTAALRYYEKEGLLPPVRRSSQKYRQYSDADLAWVRMVQCMRLANVPIRSIRLYSRLLMQGGKTVPQRYRMVRDYADGLRRQIAALENALDLTERKLEFYEELLEKPLESSTTYQEEWELFKKKGESEGWTLF